MMKGFHLDAFVCAIGGHQPNFFIDDFNLLEREFTI
jgi:hypothetical protein